MPCFISAPAAFSCLLSTALLSWDGWANSLPRPTCCYHEWKAVVETKVNGHWNKLTFFYTLCSTVVHLYLDALSCSKFHLQPHILAREEKAWTVFSAPLRSRCSFFLSSWQEVSAYFIWPQFFMMMTWSFSQQYWQQAVREQIRLFLMFQENSLTFCGGGGGSQRADGSVLVLIYRSLLLCHIAYGSRLLKYIPATPLPPPYIMLMFRDWNFPF